MFGREPVMIAAAIRAIIIALVTFGVDLSSEQIAAVMLVAETVLALITRQTVTSPATLQAAGLTREAVHKAAKIGEE